MGTIRRIVSATGFRREGGLNMENTGSFEGSESLPCDPIMADA